MGLAQHKLASEQDARDALANLSRMHEIVLKHNRELTRAVYAPDAPEVDKAWVRRFAKLQAEYLSQQQLDLI